MKVRSFQKCREPSLWVEPEESLRSDKSIQSVLTEARLDQNRGPTGCEGDVSREKHGLTDLVLVLQCYGWHLAA